MATKSVQRTLAYLRDQGMACAVAEKFNPFAGPHGQREDLFGFIDIVALSEGRILGVQACGSDWMPHVRKITQERKSIVTKWLGAGGYVQLIGWRKLKVVKKDGKKGKAERWAPRIAYFYLDSEGKITWKEQQCISACAKT